MAGMDQVEAAIGKADLQPAAVPVGDLFHRVLQPDDLAVGLHQVVQMQLIQQFLPR